MADFSKPELSSNYGDVLQAIKDLINECVKFSDGSNTNMPVGAKRFANKRFESWNGSAWVELIPKASDKYDLNVDRLDGYDAGNAAGNIPVNNSTLNVNLNADLLDGQHGAYYATAAATQAAQLAADAAATGADNANDNANGRVDKLGDTMTGQLTLPGGGTGNNAATCDQILNQFGAAGLTGVADWNDLSNTKAGTSPTLLRGSATNGPGTDEYFHALNFEYQMKTGSGNVTQFAIPYGNHASRIWLRGRYLGTWTAWRQVLTSFAFDPTLKMNKAGDTANEMYNTGWYRSTGAVGWRSQTYGGGIYMIDADYVRVFGSKAFKTDWHELRPGGNIWTAAYGLLQDKFAAATHTHADTIVGAVSGVVGGSNGQSSHWQITFTRKNGTTFSVQTSADVAYSPEGGG